MPNFADLVAEGATVPTEGWDFSWFAGRATEQRPSWGYARQMGERMSRATAALDIQTGGGEVLASIPKAPPTLAATESWPPNIALARRRLEPIGGTVHEVADHDDLPFSDGAFDLVVSRHPTIALWSEIARILAPGGTYFSQQVGAGTVHELTDFMMDPQPIDPGRSADRAARDADAAGLTVLDLRAESLRCEFNDIAAVVHFLRKVIWIVPGFTVEAYPDRLRELHDKIQRDGPFVGYTKRFLIEAVKR